MPPSALDTYIAHKFRAVGVRHHHAENFHNFSMYCEQRALLARTELRRLSAEFTRFYSDQSDEKRGALSRVFGNLRDFGVIMACGRGAIPNVYGPIQLVFRSDCFAAMSDIIITKRSIATLGDLWRAQAASTAQLVDHIASGRPNDGYISRDWMNAELSCAESRLSFGFLEKVIVEPVTVMGQRLCDHVRSALHIAGYGGVPVTERTYDRAENLRAIRAAVQFCERLPEGLPEESPAFQAVSQLPEFSDRRVEFQPRLALWARYFYFGTIAELRTRDRRFAEMMDAADAADTRESCQLCDPGDDHTPAMVSFGPLFIDGVRSTLLEEGTCDYCNGTTLRCLNCGESTPIMPRPGRHEMECSGGCGLEFAVTYTETRDGPTVDIEIIGVITPENLDEELTAILLAQYEDEFIQAALEGEYPVCEVELDQLVVTVGPEAGTAMGEWGFGASHPKEDGIYFGGVVRASIAFNADAATRSDLAESVSVDNIHADFDMGDEGDDS
jgi:hypothetical protein